LGRFLDLVEKIYTHNIKKVTMEETHIYTEGGHLERLYEISRISPAEAEQYISQRENVLNYPIEFFTLTPNAKDPKWEDVTYYTGKRKGMLNITGKYSYWIYVLSNPAMPGLLKIGYTIQDPIDRAKQISASTGIALPFALEYAFHCHNGSILEKELHAYLDSFRVSTNREFFKISLEDAIAAIEKLGDKYIMTAVDSIVDEK